MNKRSPVGILIFFILFFVIFDIYYQVVNSEVPLLKSAWFEQRIFILAAIALILILYFIVRKISSSKQKQEAFSKRLMETQEENWRQIASELHDSLGQNLLVLNNRILQLEQRKSKEDITNDKLKELSGIVQESIEEVRRISENLYPHQLTKLGLTSSIESMIRKVDTVSNIDFDVRIENIDNTLPEEEDINFFRVIQEAVNNIIKHSNAKKALIGIYKDKKFIYGKIEDDGIGFSPYSLHSGLGIQSMHERIRLIRGSINITSKQNCGSKIMFNVPIKSNIEA
jgi:signal transduction histidine kinase